MLHDYANNPQYKAVLNITRILWGAGGVDRLAQFFSTSLKDAGVADEFLYCALMSSLKVGPCIIDQGGISIPKPDHVESLMGAINSYMGQGHTDEAKAKYAGVRDAVVHQICEEFLRAAMVGASNLSILMGAPIQFDILSTDEATGVESSDIIGGVPAGATLH